MVYDVNGTALWNSGTSGTYAERLDLNDDGVADLVELDDWTSSFNYLPGVPAPPFHGGRDAGADAGHPAQSAFLCRCDARSAPRDRGRQLCIVARRIRRTV